MKREDLRAIEGLTDAQVDAIMALAGRDSTAAHAREDALQQQLTAAQQGLGQPEGQRLSARTHRAADDVGVGQAPSAASSEQLFQRGVAR